MKSSRAVQSWVLYDFATVIFAMAVAGLYFPLWVTEDAGGRDVHVAVALAGAMALIFVTAPFLGSYADRTGRRVHMLGVTTLICAALTAGIGHGGLTVSLVIFALAYAFNGAGLIFYDALLPIVSSEANRGRISGYGIAAGFGGAIVGVVAGAIVLALKPDGETLLFALVAGLFLAGSIPCLIWVRDSPAAMTGPKPTLRDDFADTMQLVRAVPGMARFLTGRVLYTDAANTIFAFMSVYSVKEVGFSETATQFVLLSGVLGGPIGAIWSGRTADRIGAKRTLDRLLVLWIVVLCLCAAIPALGLPDWLFWLVAPMGGFAFGGTGTTDRALLLTLSPSEHSGRFFGVFAMVGRFSAILGPLLWALIVEVLDLGRPAAVLTLAIMVAATLVIFRPLPTQVHAQLPGLEPATAGAHAD